MFLWRWVIIVFKKSGTPKLLRSIVKTFIQSRLPKQFLNSVQAELIKWNEKAANRTDCKLSQLPEQDIQSDPQFWYCQPKYLESESR